VHGEFFKVVENSGHLARRAYVTLRGENLAGLNLGRKALSRIWGTTKNGLEFLIMALAAITYNKSNLFFLQNAGGQEAVARYSATWELVDGVSVLVCSLLLSNVLYPLFARLWKTGREEFHRLARVSAQWLLALALPVVFVLAVESDRLIGLIYGPAYADAVWVQKYLAPTVLCAFLHNLAAYLMLSQGRQRLLLVIYLAGLVLNLGLCAALIPAHALAGAAVAILATKAAVAVATVGYCQKTVGLFTRPPWPRALRPRDWARPCTWGWGGLPPGRSRNWRQSRPWPRSCSACGEPGGFRPRPARLREPARAASPDRHAVPVKFPPDPLARGRGCPPRGLLVTGRGETEKTPFPSSRRSHDRRLPVPGPGYHHPGPRPGQDPLAPALLPFETDAAGANIELTNEDLDEITSPCLARFEVAGPRERIYFDASKAKAAIVTCGGLCPGINDVIRAIVMEAHHNYDIAATLGIRFGLQGFIPSFGHPAMELTRRNVADITSSAAPCSAPAGAPRSRRTSWTPGAAQREHAVHHRRGGTMRHGQKIRRKSRPGGARSRSSACQDIDNDISFVTKSFGFDTAVERPPRPSAAPHRGLGVLNGVGDWSRTWAANPDSSPPRPPWP
jgi:hypothetical protein